MAHPLVEHPDTEQLVLSEASRAASPSQRSTFGTTLAGGSHHSRDHHVAGHRIAKQIGGW